MTDPALTGKVLDIPAVIDLATGRTVFMRSLAYMAAIRGETLLVPAAALAAAVAELHPAHVDEIHWAVGSAHVLADPLTDIGAFAAAVEAAEHHRGDIVAGHVGGAARTRRWPIVTNAERAPGWAKAGHRVHILP